MHQLADDAMADLKELIIKELDKMHMASEHGNRDLAKAHAKTANELIKVLFADHYSLYQVK